MKKFLVFLLVPFLLALGEQFPPVSNEIVEIDDFVRPVCMIQNAKDSLIYIATVPEADEGKKEIVVVNSKLEVISRIDSATAGFAIGVLRCINYDSFGNVWVGSVGGKFYRLKSGVLEEKTLHTITATNTILCFGTKVLIATDKGYYIYNSETDSVEESGFVDNNIPGTAIDNEENIWLVAEINSMTQEPVIAYKAINNGSDWTEQMGSDSCLKDFLEWNPGGGIVYKHISFLSLFKGQIFMGGQRSLLIKNIGPGQWEENNFQDGPSFIRQASFDSLGNLWSANNYQISKFDVKEKTEVVYGYDENSLPPVWAVLCVSAFSGEIIYIATKGKIIKHNSDPTPIINNNNPKMVVKSALVPTRVYNVLGQLVYTFARDKKIELSRINLPTGTYVLRDGLGSKKVFIKGL